MVNLNNLQRYALLLLLGIMVKTKTVDGWGLPTIKYELAADGDTVVKGFCELC